MEGGKEGRKKGKSHVKLYEESQLYKHGAFALVCFKLEKFQTEGEIQRGT